MQTSCHSFDLSPLGHKTSLFPLSSLVVSVTFWLTALQCSGFMHCGVMLIGPKSDGFHLTLSTAEGIGSLAVCNSELNLMLQAELNWPRSPEALRALKPSETGLSGILFPMPQTHRLGNATPRQRGGTGKTETQSLKQLLLLENPTT